MLLYAKSSARRHTLSLPDHRLGIAQSIACLDILSGLRSIVGTNRSAHANLPARRAMI
jgi:hypothetical protein